MGCGRTPVATPSNSRYCAETLQNELTARESASEVVADGDGVAYRVGVFHGSGHGRPASELHDRARRLRLSGQAAIMTITPRASRGNDNYPAGQLGCAHL